MKSFHLLVVVVILSACEAHIHHLDHPERHHDGKSRRELPQHHPNHDLKSETISIDVTRKVTRPDNEKKTIRVTVELGFSSTFYSICLKFADKVMRLIFCS